MTNETNETSETNETKGRVCYLCGETFANETGHDHNVCAPCSDEEGWEPCDGSCVR